MAILGDSELQSYLDPLTDSQTQAINHIRGLIIAHVRGVDERIDTGKWFGGLLTYYLESGLFVFALGPRANGRTTFHMHPYYMLKELQERHAEALKPCLTGKSCITFSEYAGVSEDALIDIIKSAPALASLPVKGKK